jgi:GTPase SAR1 family protein
MSNQGTDDFKTFNYLENGDVVPSVYNTIETTTSLKPGSYVLDYENYPSPRIILKLSSVGEKHNIVSLPEDKTIRQTMLGFYNPNVISILERLGFLRKLGVLLYGKEGTGKTSILNSYCKELIAKHDAVVFQITNPYYLDKKWDFVQKVRKIQNNTVILFFDEFDAMMDGDSEPIIKSILDGALSIDNFMCMAATNYIDKIPDAIKHRLSRFKFSIEVKGIDDPEVVKVIISTLLKDIAVPQDVEKWVKELKTPTIDEVKQFCLDKIMDLPTEKSEARSIGFKYES